jgi:hypothetical protein
MGPVESPAAAAQSPIDRAITLSLEGERDSALRWAAAVVQHDHHKPSGLLLCGRLLTEAGRLEIAREALELCLSCSIDMGALPLAVAACSDLRRCCDNPVPMYETIASAFCKGSPRINQGAAAPPHLPQGADIQPLPSSLAGNALLDRAAGIIESAKKGRKAHLAAQKGPSPIAPLPIFSELPRDALLALVQLFEVATVPTGEQIIEEGAEGAASEAPKRTSSLAARSTLARASKAPSRSCSPT